MPSESLLHHTEKIGKGGARNRAPRNIDTEIAAETIEHRDVRCRGSKRRCIAESLSENGSGCGNGGSSSVGDGKGADSCRLHRGVQIEEPVAIDGVHAR